MLVGKADPRRREWFTETVGFLTVTRIWVTLCENVSSGMCGQRRPRLACASAQADQGIRCPLTLIGHYRMHQWRTNARMRLCACVGWIWICILRMLEDSFSLGEVHLSIYFMTSVSLESFELFITMSVFLQTLLSSVTIDICHRNCHYKVMWNCGSESWVG